MENSMTCEGSQKVILRIAKNLFILETLYVFISYFIEGFF